MNTADRNPTTERSEFAGDTSTLEAARRLVADTMQANGLADGDLVEAALVVVSELATNAIEAAPGSPFTVAATVDAGQVAIVVGNTGRAGDVRGPAAPDTTGRPALRGRGLGIVEALSSRVSVADAPRPDGTDGDWVEVTAVLEAGVGNWS